MASLVISDNDVHITEHRDPETAPTRIPGNSGKTRSLNLIGTEQPIPPRNAYVFLHLESISIDHVLI